MRQDEVRQICPPRIRPLTPEESMWKAVDVLRKINQLNVERNKK